MPEWYLIVLALALVSALGFVWRPLGWGALLLALAAGLSVGQAVLSAARASDRWSRRRPGRLRRGLVIALLHLVQPAARLHGRFVSGLTPWRRHGVRRLAWPGPRSYALWTERWKSETEHLGTLEAALRAGGPRVRRGGEFDRWDLDVRHGLLGGMRVRHALEQHGAGRQLVRLRTWPRCAPSAAGAIVLLALLSAAAAMAGSWTASASLGLVAGMLGVWVVRDCAGAAAHVVRAVARARAEAA
jgi:hypothetical protein